MRGPTWRRLVKLALDRISALLVDQADVDALTSDDPLERSIARLWWEHCASQAV